MKRIINISAILLAVTSCANFLDTTPDDRIDVDSAEKISKLLVSAYPAASTMLISELSSDNAKDNGAQYDTYGQVCQQAYQWDDMTVEDTDAAKAVWDAHYNAVASANMALEAIASLGDDESLASYKGEALICRAFAHFQLANLFCMPYSAETAETTLGIPYTLKPETEVMPEDVTRGTLAETYALIEADVEAGLELIDDEVYNVPKYHFNKKAAYAFAARFYLYYHKFDKVIECADVVLGGQPESMVRDWKTFGELATDFELRCNTYISHNEPCNLLLLTANSLWPYVHGPYAIGLRYGNAMPILLDEVLPGPWGSYAQLYMSSGVWGFEQKFSFPKMNGYFEYTDKTAGIGYLHLVNVAFSADETLLCRAEANLLKSTPDIDKAVADINILLNSMAGLTKTKDELVRYYSSVDFTPLHLKSDSQRTIKKKLNPQGFEVQKGDVEELIHCVLHLRRVVTVHEGLRWNDIKRYGIEISHNVSGADNIDLLVDDPRRAVQLPLEVIAAGLEANPRK